MEKSHVTEEQITYTLRQVEAGMSATQVCRELGITEQTFYRWKRNTREWELQSSGGCASLKRRTGNSNRAWLISPSIGTCSRKSSEKSFKAGPATGAAALCAGLLPGQ
jgi:transposase-like protein